MKISSFVRSFVSWYTTTCVTIIYQMFDIAVVLKFMLLSKGTAYDSGFPLFLFRLHGFM